MRLRHITGAEDLVRESAFVVHDPAQYRGRWKEAFFGADRPVHIEIGMGKGQFITEMAFRHPEISYIGIERYDTVILKALRKREELEKKFYGDCLPAQDARALQAAELQPEEYQPAEYQAEEYQPAEYQAEGYQAAEYQAADFRTSGFQTVDFPAAGYQAAEQQTERPKPFRNLVFMNQDARLLADYFAPGEVRRIYLNFSDPWPKDRHRNRRLTSPVFMDIYRKFLSPDGSLEFKTDNLDLFHYSLLSIPEAGWEILKFTENLHADPVMNAGNVMTEYEEKFSSRGNRICKLIAVPGEGREE